MLPLLVFPAALKDLYFRGISVVEFYHRILGLFAEM
jgi:hypothetical protein